MITQLARPCWHPMTEAGHPEPYYHYAHRADALDASRPYAENAGGEPQAAAFKEPCWVVYCNGCGQSLHDPEPDRGYRILHAATPDAAAAVAADVASWDVNPVLLAAWCLDCQCEHTDPAVFDAGVVEGWAEAEADPEKIRDWPDRQAAALIPFQVVGGHPVNPCESTGIRGRNEMGYWGETKMADALVVATWGGVRHLLMIERDDDYGCAVPGGGVEPGETATVAAARELREETRLSLNPEPGGELDISARPARYVPDPRASDEAWAVTTPVVFDFGTVMILPDVLGGTDARFATWIPAATYDQLMCGLAFYGGKVFAAHTAMLREFLDGGAS